MPDLINFLLKEGLGNCQKEMNADRIGRQFTRTPADTPSGVGAYLHKLFDKMWLQRHIPRPLQYTR
ncbi:hypothetical protein G114_00325 [Aeromonas diversa CDC 2478-85]|uniref:Uncharacterized protein n=1 Tax=Aeromonas diversa CDC 2478-85 TaxID=1268237 RepID=N9VQM1_9GAMM|nr:hypothetical protein G114_00325 [Aeromonas diversa CDC 2478-85]